MKEIKGFFGPYRWLSNFWICPVGYDGDIYPSSEHAYQAAKSLDLTDRERIAQLSTPSAAKREARRIKLRPDWNDVKIDVMYDIVKDKFTRNSELRTKLLATKGMLLEETNSWGDRYWGVCNGQGQNHLGLILMQVRDEI